MKNSSGIKRAHQINVASHKISQIIHNFILKRKIEIKMVPPPELSRRIRQVFFGHYLELYREINLALEDSHFNWDQTEIVLGQRKKIELRKSKKKSVSVKVGLFFTIVQLGLFFVKNLSLLILGFKNIHRSKRVRKITLVFNPSLEKNVGKKNMRSRFLEYCQKGPYSFLKNADLIICQSLVSEGNQNTDLIFTNNIYKEMIKNSPITFKDWVIWLQESLKLTLLFSLQVFKEPLLILVANDLKDFLLVKLLNRKGILENIVLNSTFMYDQRFWFHCLEKRRFQVHFLWSGMSTRRVKLKKLPQTDWASLPLFYAENNYFWNDFHKKSTQESLGFSGGASQNNINLFYLPKIKKEKRSGCKKVLIFLDVPLSRDVIDKYSLSNVYFYHNENAQMKYLLGIKQCLDQLDKKIEITVKTKKHHSWYIRAGHRQLLEEIEKWNASFFQIGDNLFNRIANSDLVVCFASSSPAFIGLELGIPTIYYDPEQNIDPAVYKNTEIIWCDSHDNLLQAFKKKLG